MSQHAAWSMIDAARRRRWPRATLAPAMLATLGLAVTVAAVPAVPAAPVAAAAPATLGEILAASPPSDWRRPDPAQTLYLELPQGRVVFELPVLLPEEQFISLELVRGRSPRSRSARSPLRG